ncbi:3-dehydroquinate synthase [Exiguobacterium aurantiacum]|uniref:3-dehydroquinate synthase n=1 Tax=Exiguobacterium aurantiacum TaxID=33987 RepID=A0ABY5FK07_9BACL|nr:3-dehydroquinate synthase family protein [Exiguobacterium aurantiacum]UTT41714.1 3-dehydroquinate synthase [Exiguobacterium aurantiacum]
MVTVHVNASTPYEVTIEQGDAWLDRVPYFTCSTVWVVTDETVDRLHGSAFRDRLARKHEAIVWSVVRPGDGSKSLETIERLVTDGLTAGCDRDTLIVAFGGGMVGDLAGFLASVYMRGVRYIQVPTTVLAHDSAVGGKVAVNHPLAKNAIGAFYQPAGVHYNVERLETLSARDVLSGLGELIKHAYLSRYVLGHSFETELFTALAQGPLDWEEWLARGVEVKRLVVEADEREQGVRAWLNFGHTFGHALESAEAYRLSHGEAILYGMVYAFLVSGDEMRAESLATYMKQENISAVNWQPFDSYLAGMGHDKKNRDGHIRFVLLGEEVTVERVTAERLAEAFHQMKRWF